MIGDASTRDASTTESSTRESSIAAVPSAPRKVPSASTPWPLYALWLGVAIAIPIWVSLDTAAWDVNVYWRAVQSLHAGHDPYASAMAVQTASHLSGGTAAGVDPPYSYVYSPLTLPLLRAIGMLPPVLTAVLYWTLYLAAALLEVWVGMQCVEQRERRVFLYLAPVAAFFPGLLANGIILGGNVAYLLYAAIFGTAILALRGRSWRWFYLAILLASCVKAPLLSLVVLPIFTARKQWVPAIATACAGSFLFGMQQLLYPGLFAHYLQAVTLQFTYNRDFGCAPAGILSGFLYDRGIPYTIPAGLFYLCYALPILGLLYHLSRHYLRGAFSLKQWLPVLMVGIILLNPRLIEYDVAPLALPLALIAWRALVAVTAPRRAAWIAATLFLVLNALALTSWSLRKLLDAPLLVVLFLVGSIALARRSASVAAGQLQAGRTLQNAA